MQTASPAGVSPTLVPDSPCSPVSRSPFKPKHSRQDMNRTAVYRLNEWSRCMNKANQLKAIATSIPVGIVAMGKGI